MCIRDRFTLSFLCFFSSSYAQEVDTIEINGESFFVYPFDVEVNTHSQFYRGQKKQRMNDMTYDLYQEMMRSELGEALTKKEFRKMKREIRQLQSEMGRDMYRDDEEAHLSSRKFKKAIRKNPYPLMQQRFQANNDLTPMLDPIPDGKYVQMYEDFCLINEKGECDWIENRVAGYFTMKNNTLEGEATWVDLTGDTLKHGFFVNGIKEGEWKFEKRTLEYLIDEDDAELYIERGYPDMDTLTEYITYEHGAKNGPYRKYTNSKYPVEQGFYKDGFPSGTWVVRDIIYKGFGRNKKRIRNNELVTLTKTYESNDSLVAKTKWLRKGLVSVYRADDDQFDFYSKYERPDLPYQLYEIAYEEEENLELEEELEGAPYDLDFYEDDYYEEMEMALESSMYGGGDFGYDDYLATAYDKNAKKYFSRGVLLDSIGGRPKYSGTYEARYENGQLAYTYEFQNGVLVKEGTVYLSLIHI